MVGRGAGGRPINTGGFHPNAHDVGSMGPDHDGSGYGGGHHMSPDGVPGNGGMGAGAPHPHHLGGMGWEHPGSGKESLPGVYYHSHEHIHDGAPAGAPVGTGGYGHDDSLGGSYHGPPSAGSGPGPLPGGGSFHHHDDPSAPPYHGPPGAAPHSAHPLHYGEGAGAGYGYGGADGSSPYLPQQQQPGSHAPMHHHAPPVSHPYHLQHATHPVTGRGAGAGAVQMNAAGQPIRIGNTSLQMAAGTRGGGRPT